MITTVVKKLKKALPLIAGGALILGFIGVEELNNTSSTSELTASEVSCQANASELVGYINSERENLGLHQLEMSAELGKAAQMKFDDMVTNHYYGHNLLDGRSSSVYARDLGITAAWSEDLGINSPSTKSDWEAFKNSPTHYESLIDADYTRIGVVASCVDFLVEKSTGPNDNSHLISTKASQLTVVQLAGEEPIVETPAVLDQAEEGCPVTTCSDGTCSYSTGRGTCSWHGGVAY